MSVLSTFASNAFRKARGNRFWEIDAMRGVAIVMMVFFHLMWDLVAFGMIGYVDLQDGFWWYYQRITASLFITLVGVSLTVSFMRAVQAKGSSAGLFPKFLKRGLFVFGLGVIASIAVMLAGTGVIYFGVLHLIGFSIIAAYPFLRFRWLNLALWALCSVAGLLIAQTNVNTLLFVWLGLTPRFTFSVVDFFPVFPWFGVVLLGVFIGNSLYGPDGRLFSLPDLSDWMFIRFLQFLGRHSLVIYLLHQPVLFAILIGLTWLGFV